MRPSPTCSTSEPPSERRQSPHLHRQCPDVLRFFCDDVGVPFYAVPNFPDYYHGMAPGSRGQGRNLQVKPFEAASLGDNRKRLRVAPAVTHRATFEEIAAWGGRAKPQGWDRELIRQRIDEDIRTFGAGLIGHLIRAALQRGIPMHTDTPIDRLVVQDGRVVGLVANTQAPTCESGPAMQWCWPRGATTATLTSRPSSTKSTAACQCCPDH